MWVEVTYLEQSNLVVLVVGHGLGCLLVEEVVVEGDALLFRHLVELKVSAATANAPLNHRDDG